LPPELIRAPETLSSPFLYTLVALHSIHIALHSIHSQLLHSPRQQTAFRHKATHTGPMRTHYSPPACRWDRGLVWGVLKFLIGNQLFVHNRYSRLRLPGQAVICEMLVRAINHAETVVLTAFLLFWEELAVRSKDLGEVKFPGGSRHGAPGWSQGL